MVPKEAKQTLQALLKDLQDGTFAEEWAEERKSGNEHMEELRASFQARPMFDTERRVMKDTIRIRTRRIDYDVNQY